MDDSATPLPPSSDEDLPLESEGVEFDLDELEANSDQALSSMMARTPLGQSLAFLCEGTEANLFKSHGVTEETIEREILIRVASEVLDSRMKLHTLSRKPPKDPEKEMLLLRDRCVERYLDRVKNRHGDLIIVSS